MWILDSSGDFLDGKRVWLRPGKKYLFGRPPQDGAHRAISDNVKTANTISRKHLTIEVSRVTPRDGTRPHTRTKVTVTDLNSKKGTLVDGEQIQGGERVLNGDEHIIQLGRYGHPLRVRWQPVVLSFSFSSKEMRVEDPLAKVRSKLEDLDIKTIIPYIVGQTTHVVQSKRNTAKGLQALTNGKAIVKNSYIDALVYATTPTDFENDEALSPLETDFDAAWPDETDYLPPPGNEPVTRPAAAFAPNPARINVFEGYTFVFGDPAQFENLQAAINNGQGKALLYQIQDGVTTAAEIVEFMREAAGQKSGDIGEDGPGKVVLVRFRSKGEHEDWSIEVGNEVALMIDRRVIEQREFLDAILGNDASPLCRPLPREEGSSQTSTSATPPKPQPQPIQNITLSPSPPPASEQGHRAMVSSKPKAPRVRKFVSKMKAFDDGFDMDCIPAYTPDDDINDTPVMEFEPEPSQRLEPPGKEEEAEEDVVTDLLPGARAMKRRREELDLGRHSRPMHVEPEAAPQPKRAKLDIRKAARKHRDEEEQQRKAEEDAHLFQDANVEDLRNLAIVEEMEIPARQRLSRENPDNDRWDEQWNGRKNFKRFRRKGEPRHARQRVQSVIVPLEEVTRKDFGIGEHQWVTSHKAPVRNDEPTEREDLSTDTPSDRTIWRSQQSMVLSASPNPTPEPQPVPSRSRTQKRPREVRDSDSDEELRFRFRRKR
ncbi:uncharacterized protein N7484_011995 [Penicillium longicatenatum]|uniref:uncharacterized protein n=1 Tax=Penicillium longicatenatum TaxID=1561947 RepID=UPI0025479169|nr:uncharacterized protein N7484_011995 [Penicillium longicatenatum]KAJ5631895.1 hypothetical protein N7484_011995 [Penicillium longicatenatum]